MRNRAAIDAFVIVAFVAALWAPMADVIARPDDARGPQRENRSTPPLPEWPQDLATLRTFPERYERYHRDTFGLRDVLLRWHSLEKLLLFDVSPTPLVVLGRERWMFYAGERSIEIWRGLDPATPAELEDWRRGLTFTRDWLAQHGIVGLYVLGPNKETIYPEYLPPALNRIGPTRFEQLTDHVRDLSDLAFVDLRPALRAAKLTDARDGPLYGPYGSHWTGRGNYVAYRAIFSELARRFPTLAPVDLAELEMQHSVDESDSWARSMYAEQDLPQLASGAVPRAGARATQTIVDGGVDRMSVFEHEDRSLPRAILFHDSYGVGIERLFAEHFSRLVTVQRNVLDMRLIAQEKPDIVLFLFVERVLRGSPPVPEGDRAGPGLAQAAFERSHDVRFRLRTDDSAAQLGALDATRITLGTEELDPGLVIETTQPGDTLVLGPFAPGEHAHAIELDITSPIDTTLEVVPHARDAETWLREARLSIPLARGRNHCFAVLAQEHIGGRLRLQPGSEPGRFVLRAFEVRALP